MSEKSKLSHDENTGMPKYDKYEFFEGGKHTHQYGGYSRSSGQYYEGGHCENVTKEEKQETGRSYRKKEVIINAT